VSGSPGMCEMSQIARFKPRGLLGLLYWYAVLPLHGVVFRGMLRGIQRAAMQIAAEDRESSVRASAS
jgi:hypothetical protein